MGYFFEDEFLKKIFRITSIFRWITLVTGYGLQVTSYKVTCLPSGKGLGI